MTALHVFGELDDDRRHSILAVVDASGGMDVRRLKEARSSTPFPKSTDLELALVPTLDKLGFEHHVRMKHPRTGGGFEYDFWRGNDRLAMEIMGYRADDEVYKDILKFHVHDQTDVGVVWVPRWKWISGRRTETNYRATMKALAFADSYMSVRALVALVYDWDDTDSDGVWSLKFVPAS